MACDLYPLVIHLVYLIVFTTCYIYIVISVSDLCAMRISQKNIRNSVFFFIIKMNFVYCNHGNRLKIFVLLSLWYFCVPTYDKLFIIGNQHRCWLDCFLIFLVVFYILLFVCNLLFIFSNAVVKLFSTYMFISPRFIISSQENFCSNSMKSRKHN